MVIRELSLQNFRNYLSFHTEFAEGVNWVHGHNGQGKTNLVEAVGFLCNLESFRTRKTNLLCHEGANQARLSAKIDQRRVLQKVKIVISPKGKQVWLNDSAFHRTSEYVLSYIALSFTPEDVSLFRGPPQERRRFFNRVISILDPKYFQALQSYTQSLAQKNAALKTGDTRQLKVWNELLAASGWKLIERRLMFMNQVQADLQTVFYRTTSREEQLSLKYENTNASCSSAEELLQNIEKNESKELQYRYALVGPHKDDYHLFLNDRIDRDYFSQGELRITNLSLKIAINQLISQNYAVYPVLIFDDVLSELDQDVNLRLLDFFSKLKNQIFVTSTERPSRELILGKLINIRMGEKIVEQ
jgi:DNA replication and repair protein RecF